MTTAFQSTAFQQQANAAAFQESARIAFEIRDPKSQTMQQWFDSMNLQVGAFDHERVEKDWQGWASRLVLSQFLSRDQAPDPYRFSDWKSWADSFNRALTSASY